MTSQLFIRSQLLITAKLGCTTFIRTPRRSKLLELSHILDNCSPAWCSINKGVHGLDAVNMVKGSFRPIAVTAAFPTPCKNTGTVHTETAQETVLRSSTQWKTEP